MAGSKYFATVDRKRCVACGACIKVCRKQAISVWKGCHARIEEMQCVGCGMCAKTCPAGCIERKERNEEHASGGIF